MRKVGSHGSAKLTTVNAAAAAIDIGSKMHMAAVDPACADNPVRSFGTFTRDLHQLADWFHDPLPRDLMADIAIGTDAGGDLLPHGTGDSVGQRRARLRSSLQ